MTIWNSTKDHKDPHAPLSCLLFVTLPSHYIHPADRVLQIEGVERV